MTKAAVFTSIVCASLSVVVVSAQNRKSENRLECRGPIYSSNDVARRARIIEGPDLTGLGPEIHGRVLVEGILCRTGRVTDIRAVDSSPPNIAEFAIAAVGEIRFKPAELNWHTVSQRMQFEFAINDSGITGIPSKDAAGRLVEQLEIVGNRKVREERILSWIKTRPGEPYSVAKVTQDFNSILARGYFDKLRSRVTIEDGARGGVVVIFEVVELPAIAEVKFQGLKTDPSVMLREFEKEQIYLRAGATYRIEEVQTALRIIKRVLATGGQENSKLDVQIEYLTAMSVNVIFIITTE